MISSPLVRELIEALRCLPGVGPKSASRMAFHLLERNRESGEKLSVVMAKAMKEIGHCNRCRTFTETDTCEICENSRRNQTSLCVVENPTDIMAIEQTSPYQGLYFVLMGHLSPIDGIGPKEIGMNLLKQRLENEGITEIILATNATVEGEATAHYIANMAKHFNIKTTRLAYGIPMGGELDLIDSNTLAHAFSARTIYDDA